MSVVYCLYNVATEKDAGAGICWLFPLLCSRPQGQALRSFSLHGEGIACEESGRILRKAGAVREGGSDISSSWTHSGSCCGERAVGTQHSSTVFRLVDMFQSRDKSPDVSESLMWLFRSSSRHCIQDQRHLLAQEWHASTQLQGREPGE
jgi:hypothetical protein